MTNKLLKGFYSDLLLVDRKAKLTAETYCTALSLFLAWCEETVLAVPNVTARDLRYYIARRHAATKSELTVAKDIASLRSFGAYLVRRRVWEENHALQLDSPKLQRNLPRVLSVGQVNALLAAIPLNNALGVRDRALFELIYSCGLRISEAAGLLTANVHLGEQVLQVTGKGDKERIAPFGADAKKWLLEWLEHWRGDLVGYRAVPNVFVNYRGEPLSRKGIWMRFQALETRSGIESKVHTLRHSYATHLLSGGADLRSVQELLGHADLSTTQIYTHIAQDELQAAHRRYLPKHGGTH